jgi:succinate dehydrogenase/fumarate reductase cytochrome b subunit
MKDLKEQLEKVKKIQTYRALLDTFIVILFIVGIVLAWTAHQDGKVETAELVKAIELETKSYDKVYEMLKQFNLEYLDPAKG